MMLGLGNLTLEVHAFSFGDLLPVRKTMPADVYRYNAPKRQ